MIDLDKLERLEKEATAGPWLDGTAICCPDMGWVDGPTGRVCHAYSTKRTHTLDANDAAFIAAARNALPALVAELRAARVVMAAARAHAEQHEYTERHKTGYMPVRITLAAQRKAIGDYDAAVAKKGGA